MLTKQRFALNSLWFSSFSFYLCCFCVTAPPPLFIHVYFFYILELGQPKACGNMSFYGKPRIAYLFVPPVATLSVTMRVVLSVFASGFLQQLLQHFLRFRHVLVHLQISSLSFLQVCCCSILFIKFELFGHLQPCT